MVIVVGQSALMRRLFHDFASLALTHCTSLILSDRFIDRKFDARHDYRSHLRAEGGPSQTDSCLERG